MQIPAEIKTEALACVKADFKAYAYYTFAWMTKKYGPSLRHIRGDHYMIHRTVLAPVTRSIDPDRTYRPDLDQEIDERALESAATLYSEQVYASWLGKLNVKLGAFVEVTDAAFRSNGDLYIQATVFGHNIGLIQQCILKSSSKGKPFHQWPARLYLDGKFTPEAAYRKWRTTQTS